MKKLLAMTPGPAELKLAGAMAIGLILVADVSVVFAGLPLPKVLPFLPIFATAVVILEGLTAFLLSMLYRATRVPFVGILSGAYGFAAVMAGFQILVFPGVFSPTGLFGAGPQSAIWVWTFWHTGYPLLVLIALCSRLKLSSPKVIIGWRWIGRVLLPAAPLAALALAILATYHGGFFPPLITGMSSESLRVSIGAKAIIIFNVLALGYLLGVDRCRSMLTLWLAIAVLASLCDSIVTLAAGQRYTLGWYSARSASLVSSSAVLGVLIWEMAVMYQRLSNEHQQLSEQLVRDGLTGLFNRAYFEATLERDIQSAFRDNLPISVLMIDADRFKSFNDTHGHQAGDQCLIQLSMALKKAARRPRDYAARFGGEEFAIVLPNTDMDGAKYCAALLGEAVRGLRIPRLDGPPSYVTISIGGASWQPGQKPPDKTTLIACADANLYRAKSNGRDTACFEQESPADAD